MHYRTLIVFLLFALISGSGIAQENNSYAKADSLSWSLYQAGEWKDLLLEGNKLIRQGTDFTNLRLRMGYAAFLLSNFSEAKQHYIAALKYDSFNQTARYYLQLSEADLNHPLIALYHSSFLIDQKDTLPYIALKNFALESSFKSAATSLRKTGFYNRIGAGTRIGSRVLFDQSLSFYGQQISIVDNPTKNPADYLPNQQFEYSGKLGYAISSRLSTWTAYHFLNTSFGDSHYQSHIGLAGLKYSGNYFEFQADAGLGTLTGGSFQQYNAALTLYPLGNLSLYGISRVSYHTQDSANEIILSQLGGVKLNSKLWLEAALTIGQINNFIEADGLYVYNSIDPGKFKIGSSLLYQLTGKSLLQLNYTQEQKQNSLQNGNFIQHSITATISWKF